MEKITTNETLQQTTSTEKNSTPPTKNDIYEQFLRRKRNPYPFDDTPRNSYGGAIGRDC